MSDMPDSMPEQHGYEGQPAAQPPAESPEVYIADPHELAHAHDHPELVADAVLDTDPPDVLLGKKVLENEGGALESAYVVYETLTTEAETAESSESPPEADSSDTTQPLARPQSVNELRIEALTQAIERYPNTPTNYVLRGEVYLALNQHTLAGADFNRALTLAEAHVDELPWGYATAAFVDRAQNGLRQVQQ